MLPIIRRGVVLALVLVLFTFVAGDYVLAASEQLQTEINLNMGELLDKKTEIAQQKILNPKISSNLSMLVTSGPGLTNLSKVELKQQMKDLKQFLPANEVKKKYPGLISEDMVYVYISLQAGSDISSLKPYIKKISDYDEGADLAAAWVAVDKIEILAAEPAVKFMDIVQPPVIQTGSVNSEGDSILFADDFRSLFGKNGSGIKVGIISDGVDHWTEAYASGDLPSNLHVLSNTVGGDEGTAMLEIVHDLAPGAELYFHDCGDNIIAFNNAIDDLVAAGCDIVCDDISWITQPFFEDGIIAQHVNSVLANNDLIYVTSAGNQAISHYQGQFVAWPSGGSWHDFSAGQSAYKQLYIDIPPGGSIRAVLQWNDRFGYSNNNYDLYLINQDTSGFLAASEVIQNGNDDPLEAMMWTNYTGGNVTGAIVVEKTSGVAKTLEVYVYPAAGAAMYTNNITASNSIMGHAAVPAVTTVGALNASEPDQIAYYSSQGPVTISYPNSASRLKPDICGIDGVSISGAGDFPTDFFGTSAAAPHIAAIAALNWSRTPSASGKLIRSKMLDGATDLGVRNNDNVYGYGRANALGYPFVDLTIASIYGPPYGVIGNTITVTDTAVNLGNKIASPCYIYYYLSSDKQITASDVYIGKRYLPSGIGIGSTNTATTTLAIPQIQSGIYYLGARIDATGMVVEDDETNNTVCKSDTMLISIPYRDLRVDAIDGPENGAAGGNISVTDTVVNSGDASTATFYIKYYLSSDDKITTADRLLGQRSLSLAAGEWNTATTSLTVPAAVPGGNYYLGAIADATNVIVESDESNNSEYDTDMISITAPYRDLRISAVDGPETAAAGGKITVTDTVVNSGDASTATFYIKYYLSSDDQITTADRLLGQRSLSLAAGGSNTAATSLTIPAAVPGGNYYLGAIADANNVIVESDETNNSGFDADMISITAPYRDLRVDAIDGPQAGAAGGRITVSNTIVNDGNASTATFYVKYYLSSDDQITTADRLLGQRSLSLAAGGSSSANTSLTIPTAVPRGNYYLGAIADATSVIVESDETNNSQFDAEIISITAPYRNLRVDAIDGPGAGAAGSKISVSDTIVNDGNASTATFYVKYYLSGDDKITTADRLLGQRSLSLAAGASSTANTTLTVPNAVPGGSYYLGAIADATNVIVESDETDNSGLNADMISITAPYRDLRVDVIDGPGVGSAGSKISVSDTIVNDGNASTSTFYVKYYLSSDDKITTADRLLGQRSLSLAAGGSNTANTSLTIPAAVLGGSYYLGAIADSTNVIVEIDESNNTGCDAEEISISAPYVDLAAISVEGPQSGTAGQKITIFNSIANQGNTNSGAFYIRWYLSVDDTITKSDIAIAQRYLSNGLGANVSGSSPMKIFIPGTVPGGSYYLGIIVDVTGIVSEADESNNASADANMITITVP